MTWHLVRCARVRRAPYLGRSISLASALLFAIASCKTQHEPAQVGAREHGGPVRGGTLHVVGSSDVDALWAASATTDLGITLVSTINRRLFAHYASANFDSATRIAPDIGLELPTRTNGGISADGRTYVVHLRRGVRWNTTPPRQVSAADFERAFRLFCNPVKPNAVAMYYEATILGMREYCDLFRRMPGSVSAIRRFVSSHELAGVRARDDLTLVFNLTTPATDFLELLALSYAAPVPEEYLDYLPDSPSFRQHTLATGPYSIAHYEPDRGYELVRNAAWDRNTDPLRPAYVDRIVVQLATDAAIAQLKLESGTADLSAMRMLTPDLASLRAQGDARAMLVPFGEHYTTMYGMLVNVVSPNSKGALQRLAVRQALAIAVDKQGILQLSGGAGAARPLYQAAPSTVSGFRAGADQFTTPNDRGDPTAARRLLRDAGFPHGVHLRLVFQNHSLFPIQAQSIQASLRRAGIDIMLEPHTASDFYAALLPDSSRARRGDWDLSLGVFTSDWYSRNNGRGHLTFFDGRQFGSGGVADYGGYDNPDVNAAIDRAISAPSLEVASAEWERAAATIMSDVAVVPLIESKDARMRGARVRNCASIGICDWSSVWLADAPSHVLTRDHD